MKAVITTINEEFEKARKKGAKDIKPRKKRVYSSRLGDEMTTYSSRGFEARWRKLPGKSRFSAKKEARLMREFERIKV